MESHKYKIAVINPYYRDGLASTIFDGLVQLNKKNILEFAMSGEYVDTDQSLEKFVLGEGEFKKYAVEADLIFLIKGKKFDPKLAEEIGRWDKTVFIDGTEVGGNRRYDFEIQNKILKGVYEDGGMIEKKMLDLCKFYFRREKPYISGIKPLPFGIESKYTKYAGLEKNIDFCCVFGQDEFPLLRRFVREILADFCKENNFTYHIEETKNSDEFYKILSQSKVGISVGGGGFDTFRFWEVLGNNCLLLTEKIDIYEPGSNRLNYNRIWQFDNVYDFKFQLEKMGQFLRNKYKQEELQKEYEDILEAHSSEARVMEIIKTAVQ